LWKRGIEGAWTTIAVIRAWDYPRIASFMASRGTFFGLPKAQIRTIFPTGSCLRAAHRAWSSWASTHRAAAGRARRRSMSSPLTLLTPDAEILVVVAPPDSEDHG
jgi:hypothetical protein